MAKYRASVTCVSGGMDSAVGAHFGQQAKVAVEIARVGIQILFRPELCWVHKDRYHRRIIFRNRPPHQRDMPLVKVTHGGDQAKSFPGGPV